MAGDLACFGVTTLDAVAAGVPEHERDKARVLVALDSKRAEVYAQAFRSDLRPLSGAEALLPADLAALTANADGYGDRVVVAGDGAGQVIQELKDRGIEAVLSTAPGVPDAATVAKMTNGEPQTAQMPSQTAGLERAPSMAGLLERREAMDKARVEAKGKGTAHSFLGLLPDSGQGEESTG